MEGTYTFHKKYSMKGHFDVVFGSVSQPLEVKMDTAAHRQVISFFDGLHSTLVRDTFYAYVYTRKTGHSCMSYNAPAFLRPALTDMLPALADFSFVEEVVENGMTLYHYAYEQVLRPSEDYNGTFTYSRTDHQDFYCLPLNFVDGKLYCQPRRWEMHGYNQWTGSHFDFYVLSYDAFDIDPLFTDADFSTPESCSGRNSATDFHPRSFIEDIFTNFREPHGSDDQHDNIRLNPSHTFTVSRTRMSETDFELFLRTRTGLVRKTVEQERIARRLSTSTRIFPSTVTRGTILKRTRSEFNSLASSIGACEGSLHLSRTRLRVGLAGRSVLQEP